MTNNEVKQFFIDNGCYNDFEIVNSPFFCIPSLYNNKIIYLHATTINITNLKNFISNDMNNINLKWFIYNNYGIDFKSTKYIRGCYIHDDKLIKYRLEKINNIKRKWKKN